MKTILCATDGTAHGDKGVLFAADLAVKMGAELTICTVNELQGGLRGPQIYLHSEREISTVLHGASGLAKKHGVKQVREVELDARDIASAVVAFAKEKNFDHIVTGTGDKGPVKKLLIGSVATSIAGSAHCPVTIAR